MPGTVIRLGTRGSQLALAQSRWVAEQLRGLGHEVALIELKTEGDIKTGPLAQIGGQGLFTKRLQQALLEGEVDLAVHSLKDLPTQTHPDLEIRAVPPREDPGDALIAIDADSIDQLRPGAIIGTGSVRRAAQLLHRRPDLEINDIRGNVETRLRKLETEPYDAIVLACAGLNRLGLQHRITQRFSSDQLLPAVGQGALGLEIRNDNVEVGRAVGQLNHADSFHAAMAERKLLQTLFAGCLAPVGATTEIAQGQLRLTGVVLSRDGQQRLEASASGRPEDWQGIGIRVAEALLDQGAGPLLQRS